MGRGWTPIAAGAAIVVATFLLAQVEIFKPSAPAAGSVTGGDVYRGELVGSGLDAAEIAATVEQGVGVMPPALVSGQDQADVVAYVVSIAAP